MADRSAQTVVDEGYVFTKVKATGTLFNKDRFLHYYRLTPGEPFDKKKHEHSLEKMRTELRNEGYLAAKIADTVSYNKKSKTVQVALSVSLGNLFIIDKVTVALEGGGNESQELKLGLEKLLEHALVRQALDKEVLDRQAQEIKAWLRKKGYSSPQLSLVTKNDGAHKASLSFSVVLPAKKELVFVGNSFFTTENLLDEIFAADGDELLPAVLLAEDIEALYKSKGFFEVHVTWKEHKGKLTFTVAEGMRASPWMRGVKLSYSDSKPDALTSPILQKMIAAITALAYYDAEEVQKIVAKAQCRLVKVGYWDASLDMKQPEKVALLTIAVKFGERRIIQNLLIEGYPELEKEPLFSPWKDLTEPSKIRPDKLEEQRRWLQSYFRQRGYLYVVVQEQFKKTARGPTLIWKIDTKQAVRFGKTSVRGLQRMKPSIVCRELAYAPGDVWQREKIERTAQRLKCLGMFESVSIAPDTSGNTTGNKQAENALEQPVIITCIEDDPIEIKTRLGFQFVSKSFTQLSWTTYKIGGSLLWKNPAGIADTLSLDADLTRYSRNLAAAYEVPWLGSWPIRTQARMYSDRFDQPLIGSSSRRLYKEEHDGISVTFQHSHPWWESSVKVGFEVNKLFGISPELARVIQFQPALVDRSIPYFYAEPTVIFESRDNKADPCKGIYTSLSCKAMVPPKVRNAWFIRALIEQSLFYPLYGSIIGALHWRVGHIFNAQFSTILPTERFYLGGANSLRGYETNMVPPLNDLTCDGCTVWVPVGGKTMANINAEIRFPIYRWVGGVIFTDLGVLAQDRFADIAANKWLAASGCGLRVATPLGPVRFDIGWKWKKRDPRDRRYAWFITFGHAF